jgi:hypothetical protein
MSKSPDAADDESALGEHGESEPEPVGDPNLLRFGRSYDPSPLREQTRSRLALLLVLLLATVALSLIVFSATKLISAENAKDLVAGVLSPLIALTGTALGFYFGGRSGSR